ncbi:uncharacterized protein YqhG [Scopulibacillus darangshiensis]|uniref:Uncharacterized protein YqhG n=1 Tax=Scopulibacillus darangshiensis TaxID=442528 RepID=A0A4R2P859_9BACL|nr:YqhG family protein [Scopulibacillus darangshiensis]TCP31159.1 uncharacterized protein YqhG [Scopulibacillus darangshiensis]
MKQAAIHNYLEQFFRANECDIIENRQDGLLKVKLTTDLDKLMMNRPFYWHYIEKIGGTPETATLTLKTNQLDEGGEFIHFGSPRLHQIFSSTKKLAPYIRLYHDKIQSHNMSTPLAPWLGINIKVSYQCDLKKDELLSLGLHLINGTIATHFHDQMEKLTLTPKIPNYCYTLAPLIKPFSGIRRMEVFIQEQIHRENHKWADDAKERWQNDQQLLEHFYEEDNEKPEAYLQEKAALKDQYEPNIHVQIINGGLFYLDSSVFIQ